MYRSMTVSLKSFGEHLAPLLGLTPNALYERQRALVRLGELPAPTKGRGHGLSATASTVAILVVSAMATDNFSDTDARVQHLARARAKQRCGLTGKALFVDALSALFASPDLAAKVIWIRVYRSTMAGEIAYDKTRESLAGPTPHMTPSTLFGRVPSPGCMQVEASLWGNLVGRIAQLLNAEGATVK